MPSYVCECCNFKSFNLNNFKSHQKTKKHQVNMEKMQNVPELQEIQKINNHDFIPSEIYHCKTCNKCFKYKQSMYRHIKYYCKKQQHDDTNELIKLLYMQLEEKNKQINILNICHDNEINDMQEQINNLTNKVQINNVHHNNVKINVTSHDSLTPQMEDNYIHSTVKSCVMEYDKDLSNST